MTNRTDNFNRADTTSNIGTPSDGGSDWVSLSGTWGITNNQAYKSATNGTYEVVYLESSVSAVEVQMTISTLVSAVNCGPCGRIADNLNYIFVDYSSGAGGVVALFKNVAGSFIQIGSNVAHATNVGDVVKLRMDSSNNLTVFVNGTSLITANDSFGSTNTKHGLSLADDNTVAIDDFSITEITAGGGAGPRPTNVYRGGKKRSPIYGNFGTS